VEETRAEALRRSWGRRVDTWREQVFASPAFRKILEALLMAAEPRPDDRVVDLGAGTGFVTLPLAERVKDVLAVDISSEMLADLKKRLSERGLTNVTTQVADISELDLPEQSYSLVVSSYTLHHLRDDQKAAVIGNARRWLRSGGRLVIADMMFGRGGSQRDRRIIREKVVRLAKKGPIGWWRIGKNLVRFGLRKGTDLPSPPEFWLELLRKSGFQDVDYRPIVSEAGLVSGRAP
jgi:ubiquinone/menaquinone biosynthesis C-methylase UbiE